MKKKVTKLIISIIVISSTSFGSAFSEESKESVWENIISLETLKERKRVTIERNIEISINNLEELITSHNHELEIMQMKIEQAKYTLKSKLALWYPTLDISGSGLPQYLEGSTYNNSSADTSSQQFKASLSAKVKWDLINPSRIPDIEEARDKLKNEEIAFEIKRKDLYLESLNRFFKLQQSNEEVRIAKDSITTSETSLNEAKIRLEVGIGTKFEVLEANTQLSKDKQMLARKLGEQKINQRKLAKILNMPSNSNPIISSKPTILGIWDSSLEESIISALKFKKDLQKLLIELSITNNQANSALASNQPTISLFNTFSTSISKGEVGVIDPDASNEVFSESNTIGIQFDWKLFDGGYSKSSYYAKKGKAKEINSRIDLKQDEIREEVEESFFNLGIAKENIKNTYNEIISARESLRLALLRLKAGITTQREVVSNQRDLTQAEVNYIVAITNYNSNLVNLRRHTGIERLSSCNKRLGSNNMEYDSNQNENYNQTNAPCLEFL